MKGYARNRPDVVSSGLLWRLVGYVSGWFVPGRVAVTLGRTIFGYLSNLPPSVLAHERAHVRQFEREGCRMWLRYAGRFFLDWIRFRDRARAYRENPYEVEARREAERSSPPRA